MPRPATSGVVSSTDQSPASVLFGRCRASFWLPGANLANVADVVRFAPSSRKRPRTPANKTLGGAIGGCADDAAGGWSGHFVFRGTAVDTPLAAAGRWADRVGGRAVGDLMLSSVKRDVGIKDWAVIPGTGGSSTGSTRWCWWPRRSSTSW